MLKFLGDIRYVEQCKAMLGKIKTNKTLTYCISKTKLLQVNINQRTTSSSLYNYGASNNNKSNITLSKSLTLKKKNIIYFKTMLVNGMFQMSHLVKSIFPSHLC